MRIRSVNPKVVVEVNILNVSAYTLKLSGASESDCADNVILVSYFIARFLSALTLKVEIPPDEMVSLAVSVTASPAFAP